MHLLSDRKFSVGHARVSAIRRSSHTFLRHLAPGPSTDIGAGARERLKPLSVPRPGQVMAVAQREQARRPAPPFTTSTLQQEASAKLGLSPARTMALAQQLYEGVEEAGGAAGPRPLRAAPRGSPCK